MWPSALWVELDRPSCGIQSVRSVLLPEQLSRIIDVRRTFPLARQTFARVGTAERVIRFAKDEQAASLNGRRDAV